MSNLKVGQILVVITLHSYLYHDQLTLVSQVITDSIKTTTPLPFMFTTFCLFSMFY